MGNIKIKKMIFALVFTLAACKQGQTEMKKESDITIEEIFENSAEEETTVEESMNLEDITDENTRNTLIKIDELNHQLGEAIKVSKEDYLKYRDVNVSLIGDSIAEFSKTYLKKNLRNIWQDSVPGREMDKGIEAFEQMKEVDKLGDVMILSLGNNAMKGIDFEVLEYVYNGIEGKPLIIPTIVMPYAGQERNRNRDLKSFVDTHENCYLADWNKIARMSDTFISEDGVHPTGEGSRAYAQLMLKMVVETQK